MKSVLIIASTLMALAAEGKTTVPADSLKISKDISLDEVVVTATKVAKGTPVAYSELTKDELNRRNDGQGIPFLILQSPSVIMTSDAGTGIGYSGFRIRGTDANRINITINGVPVNDSESHTVFWVNMPDFASSVDNIQIQRGAGTSTNGAAAFGATVAMQTQKSELKPYAEYSVSAGSFGTVKNTVKLGTGLLQDHFVFDARYSNIQSDEVLKRIEDQFDLIHNNFMKRLHAKHPDLSNNERMMCAYLKMNLSTKEIAPLLNISVRGVETIRYRLRKKFGLEREDSLTDYLSNYL